MEKLLHDFVEKSCNDHGQSHGIEHIERVVNMSKYIYEKIVNNNIDEKIYNLIITIAYLHDVSDHKYDPEKKMIPIINNFLIKYFSQDDINLILKIIDNISYSKEYQLLQQNLNPDYKNILGKIGCFIRDIISDADKLDALGKIGLERCLQYQQEFYHKKFNKPISYLSLIKNVIDHSNEKLLKLKDNFIKTEIGKKLAEPLHNEILTELNKLQTVPVNKLYLIAGGLNIEGGYPYQELVSINKNAKWINIIFVLDRPFIDNITFDNIMEIVSNNKYLLLENAIDTFNEHQMLVSILLIVIYYIEQNPKKILIHFHQDKIAKNLIEIFNNLLIQLKLILNLKNSTEILFTTDDYIYKSGNPYYDVDILMSISQCCGLDPNYFPGAILLPDNFIPFDIKKNIIYNQKSYVGVNDLVSTIDEIISSPHKSIIVNYINKFYISANKNKNYQAKILTKDDFIISNILQVSDLWNPTDPNELVNIQLY